MPIRFEPGVVHECDDCGQRFTDNKNELSIFNTDRCIECDTFREMVDECTDGVEEPEVDEAMANFFMRDALQYATA